VYLFHKDKNEKFVHQNHENRPWSFTFENQKNLGQPAGLLYKKIKNVFLQLSQEKYLHPLIHLLTATPKDHPEDCRKALMLAVEHQEIASHIAMASYPCIYAVLLTSMCRPCLPLQKGHAWFKVQHC
jgi:hypothetical protein